MGEGFGLGNACIVLTLSGAMFCVGHCWYRDNTFLSPNLRSLCSIEFPRQTKFSLSPKADKRWSIISYDTSYRTAAPVLPILLGTVSLQASPLI